MWSQAQRDFAVQRLGIPAAKITLMPYLVDQRFWRPLPIASDQFAAVGNEMRDYDTLLAALQGLALPCEIIASRWTLSPQAQAMVDEQRLPAGVSLHTASYTELRDVYARAIRRRAAQTLRHEPRADGHSRSDGDGQASHLLARARPH
ncbi:MAG: hypothetical protein ACHQ1E_11685 [Ktedonobacterales bacterium]|jgi:hypothetical protein